MARVDALDFESSVLGAFDLEARSNVIDLDSIFARKAGSPNVAFVSPALDALTAGR